MRKFEGARWAPAMRKKTVNVPRQYGMTEGFPAMRRNDGGPTTSAEPKGYDIYGYGGDHNTAASNPVAAPASHPKLDPMKPIVEAAAKVGQKGGMRKAMTPQLLSSIAMGGLAGLGGGKGIAAAMVMQGANILKNYLDQKKKVGATPSFAPPQTGVQVGMKKGGKVKMKGIISNAQRPNKQQPAKPAKPATQKAAHGGAMKKKKY